MSPGSITFDLVVRDQIEIATAPQVVWTYLDRLEAWKESVASVDRLAGSPGRIGELVRVNQRSGRETVPVLMKTLRIEPHAYRVQTLDTENDNATRGYVIYSLEPRGPGCTVTCDVVAKCELPATAIRDQTLEAFSEALNEATRVKLEADHQTLKQLIERGAAPTGER